METMYIKHEMYYVDGQVCKIILVQKNRIEDGSMWILGPGSFKVIRLFESQIQASIVVSTNQYGTSTNVANIKLET